MRKLASRYGEIFVAREGDLISHSISVYGEWAQNELDLISNFIKAGDTVLDVGANLGAFTRAFSQLVGKSGKVLAFEPVDFNFKLLSKNSEIAESQNIETFKFALGDVAGCFNISINPNNLGASKVSDSGDNIESIELRTLDDIGVSSPINFMKIDVEGMEFSVLKGASKTIKRYQPKIFLEVNSLESSYLIFNWAKEQQYTCYSVVSKAFNSQNFHKSVENIFDENSECGLLLIPQKELTTYQSTIERLELRKVTTVDDLALMLLQKPQYLVEMLPKFNLGSSPGCSAAFNIPSELISKLNDKLVRENQELTHKCSVLKADLGTQQERYEESARQISLLNTRIQQQGDDIYRIQSSRSWKLTEPLRFLADRGRGVKNTISKRVLRSIGLPELPASPDRYIVKDELPILRTKQIAVVLPVYKDTKLTLACIKSAMPGIKNVSGAFLVIINDASPEEGMAEMLAQVISNLGEGDRIKLITNPRNLGFVASVNAGINSNPEADIVLLNSDVIVPMNWLERLATEAYSLPNIGTATPLSNNTTICTFPEFLQDNKVPLNLTVDEVNQAFCSSRLPNVEAPTGVGFCMYMRRQCINEVGLLSQEHFGRGYGEENDFCQRAFKKGWRNIITPNLYAFHQGGVSFGPEKAALIENASRVLHTLHPNYHSDVHQFIKCDPLKKSRIFRLINLLGSIHFPKIVQVSHGVGGGVDQHITELSEYLYQSGQGFSLVLKPDSQSGGCRLRFGWKNTADELVFRMPEELEALTQVLKSVGVSLVHYHHVLKMPEQILNLASYLRVPHRVTIHDFYLLAANPTLTDEHGVFDASNPLGAKNPLYPLAEGETPESWRESYRSLLERADRVIFPTVETKRLFGNYYDIQRGVIAPHLEISRSVNSKVKKISRKSWYKISVLGALGKEKGADYLEAIARSARKQGSPWSFELIGYAYRPLRCVVTLGSYEAHELRKRISDSGSDFIFFPARWPETYSYTLSSALESGLPIIAPKLGAFPERLSGRENVLLFEPHLDPNEIVQKISNFMMQIESGLQVKAPEFDLRDIKSDYYQQEYLTQIPSKTADYPIELGQIKIDSPSGANKGVSHFRDSTYRVLVRLSWHPSIRWLRGVVPQRGQKFVRRLLSN